MRCLGVFMRRSAIVYCVITLAYVLEGHLYAENPYSWSDPSGIGPTPALYISCDSLERDSALTAFSDGLSPGRSDAYFSRSLDRGTSWSDPVLLGTGDSRYGANIFRVHADVDGSVYVAWVSHSVFLNVSHDGGVTWKPRPVDFGFSL